MQRIGLFLTGLCLSASAWAQAGLDYTPTKVDTDVGELADNAIELFDKVAPVILAVVGLTVLIHFVKKIKKG